MCTNFCSHVCTVLSKSIFSVWDNISLPFRWGSRWACSKFTGTSINLRGGIALTWLKISTRDQSSNSPSMRHFFFFLHSRLYRDYIKIFYGSFFHIRCQITVSAYVLSIYLSIFSPHSQIIFSINFIVFLRNHQFMICASCNSSPSLISKDRVILRLLIKSQSSKDF